MAPASEPIFMDTSRRLRNDSSPRTPVAPSRTRQSFDRHFNVATMKFLRWILALTIFTVTGVSSSHIPDKYPIEVYHMLQERTQYGHGRDNRVRGTWGSWSPWSECSRTCGTGVQSQARECVPFRRHLRKRNVIPENGTSSTKPTCIGTNTRYHTCNTQECLNFTEDLRTEQCAKYNGRNYKGHNYVWVPFLDAPNSCALNCRAVGERFYATLEPAVMDGTPCDAPNLRGHNKGISMDRTERWICVAGQCRAVGCDGVIGSGVTMDACGVCGGQGKSCRLYEGIFMDPILPKGHRPVTTIPKDAMALNISELRFSNNFLALRDSNGSYILNGPWSYSPSGTYKAAGTTLTYQRGDKNRIECISATGPLNESLHLEILSQEMNQGILYKYMMPVKEGISEIAPPLLTGSNDRGNEIPNLGPHLGVTIPVPKISHRHYNGNDINESGIKEEMKHPPTTVMAGDQPKSKSKRKKRKRKFAWKVAGLTTCSKECGGGIQSTIFKCYREINQMVVNDKRCRHLEKPQSPPPLRCNNHPCAARWKAEPWGECSVTCGNGMRTRKIECVQELNGRLMMRVAAGACSQPPDLRTVETCTRAPCPNPELRHMQSQSNTPRWNVGPWGACSATCGRGLRNRTVTCITFGESCSLSDKPNSQEFCELPPCSLTSIDSSQRSPWLYSEWSSKCSEECGSGVETRKVACSDGNELFCNPNEKPITERPCNRRDPKCDTPQWFTGPWSSCSVSCGLGVQYRPVLCVMKTDDNFEIRSDRDCNGRSKPSTEQICEDAPCGPEWFTSDWSQCSASCGFGVQNRLVHCILEGIITSNCSEITKPIGQQKCHDEICKKELTKPSIKPPKKVIRTETTECVDKYHNCSEIVNLGLCHVKYYKHLCCQCRG